MKKIDFGRILCIDRLKLLYKSELLLLIGGWGCVF